MNERIETPNVLKMLINNETAVTAACIAL
jgi:hypothetical protein